jgi:glycosyl transferase family 2
VFGWLRRARPPASPEARDREVDRLYALGGDAWMLGDLPRAESYARSALALDRSLPTLHYLLGAVRFDRRDYAGTIEALEACLERGPKYPLAQHARARAALARSRLRPVAPAAERMRGAAPSISVVICSITPAKFERVRANYSELLHGLPHEVVGIHDARSLAEGYNRGVRKARGDVLVFSHDDIEIVTPDFAAKLVNRLAEVDLIGVAGTDRICGGSWIDAGWPHVFGQIGTPAAPRIVATAFVMPGATAAPMQGLDGVFFACRRAVAEKTGFDERTFDGWHLYDLDFSYSAAMAGFRLSVCSDVLIVHQSPGNFGDAWLKQARKFVAKHLPDAQPEQYAFRQLELCSLTVESAQEWRSLTAYMTESS